MDNVLDPSLLPITLSPAISEGMRQIAWSVRKLLFRCEQAHQLLVYYDQIATQGTRGV